MNPSPRSQCHVVFGAGVMEKQLEHRMEALNGINAFVTRDMKDMIFSIYLPTYLYVCLSVCLSLHLSLIEKRAVYQVRKRALRGAG